jgi:hypothetical protein
MVIFRNKCINNIVEFANIAEKTNKINDFCLKSSAQLAERKNIAESANIAIQFEVLSQITLSA